MDEKMYDVTSKLPEEEEKEVTLPKKTQFNVIMEKNFSKIKSILSYTPDDELNDLRRRFKSLVLLETALNTFDEYRTESEEPAYSIIGISADSQKSNYLVFHIKSSRTMLVYKFIVNLNKNDLDCITIDSISADDVNENMDDETVIALLYITKMIVMFFSMYTI